MTENFSLSIFTIEADLKPLLAFAAKRHEEAEAFFRDERLRTKLRSVNAGGTPLCHKLSILRFRLATAGERVRYRERLAARPTGPFAVVFLVDLDPGETAPAGEVE